ncbi:MAG TPA: proteasome-type protease [Steroidobacteraceae bacterium]|nr:proteasome-type protease [Steroidobacteraceae bacterium]
MTYCVGMLLDTGLVFLADSRTSAGVDHINSFRKTFVFQRPGNRVVVLQVAGNLAITQAVVSLLREHEDSSTRPDLDIHKAPTMFEAARCVGEAMREVYRRDADSLKEFNVEFNANMILGGQIRGENPRLFHIYSAGNFIEALPEKTFFQIGESKYGKPIIDRVIRRSSSLNEATKCALVSMDSTIQSNLSVGLPLDLVIVRRDQFCVARHMSIDSENAYFRSIRSRWSAALREAFVELPDPDWLSDRALERPPATVTKIQNS